tara:strand:- start:70 stop:1350 length:1281 start_codon:yes stop_codon:yes gene_type:complete
MNPYSSRDLGAEYQQGIFDMLRGAKDLWLQSGIGLLNPNNPVYKKRPEPKNLDELRGLLDDPDLEYIESLPSLDPGGFMRGMTKVFHGSPHLFKNWDFSKMGSGEGAQAFGHGGYFAGSKRVGEHYAENLGKYIDPHHTYKGQKFETFDPWNKAYADVKGLDRRINHIIRNLENDKNLTAKQFIDNEIKGFEKGIEFLKKNPEEYKDLPEDMSIKGFQNIIDEYKSLDPNDFKFVPQGKQSHLYEIELRPDPEDFPMYDLPLREQPMAMEKINSAKNRLQQLKKERDWTLSQIQEKKKASGYKSDLPDELKWADEMFIPTEDLPKLKPIEDEIQKLESALFIVDRPERSIMNLMSPTDMKGYKTPEWKPGAEIAEAFRNVGFPGHRFLDGMSRSGRRPEKNFNYVVYPTNDPDMIKITNPPQSLLD